jgi:drug/metabolite transporter (DMT)-like permease
MFNAFSPAYKGILLALAGYTGFSVADACAKYLTPLYSIYQIVTVETFIAAIILLAFSPFFGGTKDLFKRKFLKINLARGVLNLIITLLVTLSFKYLPLADAYTVIFLMPFMATILSVLFYGQKTSGQVWAAIVFGFSGIVVAFQPTSESFNPFILIPAAAALAIAVMFILSRSLQGSSILSLGFWPMAVSSVLCFPLALTDMKSIDPAHIWIFVIQAGGACIGLTCLSMAFRMAPASLVSPFLYTQMIWGLIFGIFIFGDYPDAWMLIGSAIVILSGIYLTRLAAREPQP